MKSSVKPEINEQELITIQIVKIAIIRCNCFLDHEELCLLL